MTLGYLFSRQGPSSWAIAVPTISSIASQTQSAQGNTPTPHRIKRIITPDPNNKKHPPTTQQPTQKKPHTHCTVNNPSPNPPIHSSVSTTPFSFRECAPACSNAISFSAYLCAVPACAIVRVPASRQQGRGGRGGAEQRGVGAIR